MKEVKINYNNTFATQRSRDYYRGASFHWSGKWMVGAHYVSDDYNVDFVVHGHVLMACAKSHLATIENEPKDFIVDESGTIVGVVSKYWDFVISGITGRCPGVKIVDKYWYTCEDTGVKEEDQVWVNTGVKASFEFSDLTPEEIAQLQEPGIQVVNQFVENVITQTTGDNPDKIMSQKAVTEGFTAIGNELSQKFQVGTTAYWNSKTTYVPRPGDVIIYSDYATKTVDGVTVNIPGIKIGSGNAYLVDLAFVGEAERAILLAHMADTNSHITVQERGFWNNKLNVDDLQEVVGETLILNRN